MGDGSLSTVFHAICNKTGKAYALKVIDKFYIQRHKMVDAVIRERRIMDQLHSDLVVRLHFTFQDEQKVYMGMTLYPAGDLFEQIQARKPLPPSEVQFYAAEMVLILDYLRLNHVVFRDFKPENLLLNDAGHLVLTDFGCAKILAPGEEVLDDDSVSEGDGYLQEGGEGAATQASCQSAVSKDKGPRRKVTFVGTADYLAPEILNNTSCTHAVDLWGFGCMLYQLITGSPPFRCAHLSPSPSLSRSPMCPTLLCDSLSPPFSCCVCLCVH
jgi:3-phosphoinositide dependent protein kinase-1